MVAVKLLTNEGDADHQHGMETIQFHELQSRCWEVIVKHTYREWNCAADFLDGLGYDYPFGCHMILMAILLG
ncbi:hypothetical protein LINPERHAP2_LOCUS38058 [Linum perenne]